MRLGTRLYLLVAGTVVPLAGLAVVLGALLVDHERGTFQRLAMDRNRALMSAVDAELRGHIATLRALGANVHLIAGDTRAFHEQAARTLKSQPDWDDVILSDAAGRELLAGTRSYGDALPEDPDRQSLERAVATREPAVGSIRRWVSTGRYAVALRLPVIEGPRVAHVLTAVIAPRQFEQLINAQNLPDGWVTGLVDSTGHFIARLPSRSPADVASPQFRAAVAAAGEGWYRGYTVDGFDTFTAHIASRVSGWSLGLAVPTKTVQASARRFGWALAIGTLATVGIALLFAWWMSRRITRPIAGLAKAARQLGSESSTGGWRVGDDLEEVRDVQQALDAAEAAIREREALQTREQVALKAADRAKDEFLAMLGHELRNPLSAITTSSHVLRAAPAGSRMHTQAQAIIERQARQMTRLVEDLLDVSRLTMGKVALQTETFDLAQLASVLVQTWEQSGRVSPGRIRVEAAPAWVEADRARIEQVLANLLDNAHRFTPAGRHIYVRVGMKDRGAALQVADEGAGIAPHLLEQVFKPFAQAPQGVDRSHGGLGLGLAVVRRLVDLHGGTVAVESEGEGRGATFTVTFPGVEAPHTSQPHSEPLPMRAAAGLRVLVVEDGEDAREMMHAMLTLHGHEVRTAANGAAGLAEAERFRPDVVLLDIGLPDIDGYEVARRLRARDNAGGARLVALTGYGQSEDEAAAYAAGFDRHMTKPVAPDSLARMLAELGRPRAKQPTAG
jgi:signal transduction histidine kinase/ActR/RegA family two-component response regulator